MFAVARTVAKRMVQSSGPMFFSIANLEHSLAITTKHATPWNDAFVAMIVGPRSWARNYTIAKSQLSHQQLHRFRVKCDMQFTYLWRKMGCRGVRHFVYIQERSSTQMCGGSLSSSIVDGEALMEAQDTPVFRPRTRHR